MCVVYYHFLDRRVLLLIHQSHAAGVLLFRRRLRTASGVAICFYPKLAKGTPLPQRSVFAVSKTRPNGIFSQNSGYYLAQVPTHLINPCYAWMSAIIAHYYCTICQLAKSSSQDSLRRRKQHLGNVRTKSQTWRVVQHAAGKKCMFRV